MKNQNMKYSEILKMYIEYAESSRKRAEEIENKMFNEDISRNDIKKEGDKLVIMLFETGESFYCACVPEPINRFYFIDTHVPLIVDGKLVHFNKKEIIRFEFITVSNLNDYSASYVRDFLRFNKKIEIKFSPLRSNEVVEKVFYKILEEEKVLDFKSDKKLYEFFKGIELFLEYDAKKFNVTLDDVIKEIDNISIQRNDNDYAWRNALGDIFSKKLNKQYEKVFF